MAYMININLDTCRVLPGLLDTLPDVFDMFTESRLKREGKCRPTCLSCDTKIVLSNKSSVIERSSEFDYRSFVNQTFDCIRLAKFYCEFDYVRLSSAIDWCSIGFD